MTLRVNQELLDQIRSHAEESYPHECCGFLLGTNEDGSNVLKDIFRARNEWPEPEESESTETTGRQESRRNRYLITPEQWRQADSYARGRGLGIIGYYHSHPDHPAVPSGFDLDHSCWPTESYLIVSVDRGRATTVNSFNKPDYDAFEQERIIID